MSQESRSIFSGLGVGGGGGGGGGAACWVYPHGKELVDINNEQPCGRAQQAAPHT